MDSLGQRIIRDEAEIEELTTLADRLERDAVVLRNRAAEVRRLLDLAKLAQKG